MAAGQSILEVDELDLDILQAMIQDARVTFKDLAVRTNTDQRTIASRFQRMVKSGVIRRATLDIDWSRLGLTALAFMGSTTALGEQDRKKLFDFIRKEPRILESHTTIGAHEYFLKALDVSVANLRAEVCGPLEPLTADLTTSVVTDWIKRPDYAGLFRYLRREVTSEEVR